VAPSLIESSMQRRWTWAVRVAVTAALAACGCTGEEHFIGYTKPRPVQVTIRPTTMNTCPRITFMWVAPLDVEMGTNVELYGQVEDPDGDRLVTEWRATSGTVVDPAARDTAFVCEAPGTSDITFEVMDVRGCAQQLTAPVTCE